VYRWPVRPVADDSVEIFRFEYHPENGNPRRLRVVMDADDALYFVTEFNSKTGWRISDRESIDYFEYSDEDLDKTGAQVE
jgi:hypothetical protein